MSVKEIEKIKCDKFNFDIISNDVYRIISENKGYTQIGLTHSEKSKTDYEKITESIGSNYDRDAKIFKFGERDFTIFNERYIDTEIYRLYNEIGNIGRARIMVLKGPSCYSIHKDLSKRYHYPIKTNIDCLFIFPSLCKMHHLQANGNLYLVDTRLKHTYVNGSYEDRIHLVFDDLTTLKI